MIRKTTEFYYFYNNLLRRVTYSFLKSIENPYFRVWSTHCAALEHVRRDTRMPMHGLWGKPVFIATVIDGQLAWTVRLRFGRSFALRDQLNLKIKFWPITKLVFSICQATKTHTEKPQRNATRRAANKFNFNLKKYVQQTNQQTNYQRNQIQELICQRKYQNKRVWHPICESNAPRKYK